MIPKTTSSKKTNARTQLPFVFRIMVLLSISWFLFVQVFLLERIFFVIISLISNELSLVVLFVLLPFIGLIFV